MSFDFSSTQLGTIAVHQVGNFSRDEGIVQSNSELVAGSELMRDLFLRYFLSPFTGESELFHFSFTEGKNEIFEKVCEIFENPAKLHENSVAIAQHLYFQSQHPKIKSGELYVVYLKGCVLGDELADAIGIFKSENKETFLKVMQSNSHFDILAEIGASLNGLEKGCLIFNTDKEKGYVLAMTDAINKQHEAAYWKDAFLNVCPQENALFFTKQYMELCKAFTKQNVSPEDIVAINDRLVQFFAQNYEFDASLFESDVFGSDTPEMLSFRDYRNEIGVPKQFSLPTNAERTARKYFKNTIKLDNNFRINIGKYNDNIQWGYDEDKNMKFVKFYYEQER